MLLKLKSNILFKCPKVIPMTMNVSTLKNLSENCFIEPYV